MPGHVVGDGRHTIAELIEIVNQDPRRGVGHEKVLTRLELDEQAERMMALWPNKGEHDARPALGEAYERIEAVEPNDPAVPPSAPGALRLPIVAVGSNV